LSNIDSGIGNTGVGLDRKVYCFRCRSPIDPYALTYGGYLHEDENPNGGFLQEDEGTGQQEIFCLKCAKQNLRKKELQRHKELWHLAQSRKKETVPNGFGIEIFVEIAEKYPSGFERTRKYRFPCGYECPVAYTNMRLASMNHSYCKTCQIMLGKTRSRIARVQEVADLFCKGYTGYKSHSGALKSEGRILKHHWGIEAIVNCQGKIIKNDQHIIRSSGYTSQNLCPYIRANAYLPISTLTELTSKNLGRFNEEILTEYLFIVDQTENETLFCIEDKYYLYGNDQIDFRRYLVELTYGGNYKTCAEAIESMKPFAVRVSEVEKQEKGKDFPDVERQGDLFFIPDPDLTDEQMDSIESAHFNIETEESIENAPITKYKVTPSIMTKRHPTGTNHKAQHVGVFAGQTFVKGYVRHGNRDHQKLILDKDVWYLVVDNEVERSISLGARND